MFRYNNVGWIDLVKMYFGDMFRLNAGVRFYVVWSFQEWDARLHEWDDGAGLSFQDDTDRMIQTG